VITRVVLVAVVLAALAAALAGLERTRAAERDTGPEIRALLTDAERAEMTVAAVTLRGDDGSGLIYARSGGVWRCLSVDGAIARTDLVQALIDAATRARGVVRSREPADPEAYGLGARGLVLGLHGPGVAKQEDRDLLFELELGASLPQEDASYVRRPGRPEVLAVDDDLRARVPWAGPGSLPPLLDPYVIPASWAEEAEAVLRVLLERTSGPGFDLEASFAPPDLVQAGAPRVGWRLTSAEGTADVHPVLASAYGLFLQRAPWSALADPASAGELGLDDPAFRITLTPRRGPPYVLLGGAALSDGSVPVSNPQTGQLFLVGPAAARLLVPEPALLLDPSSGNPFDEFLARPAPGAPR
jgi:hypothetical protein